MRTRVAMNGFGRIGRQVVRSVHERYWDVLEIAVIGITDPHITEQRALLLKYDSVYGRFDTEVDAVVEGRTNAIKVDDRLIDMVGRNPYGPVPEWRSEAIVSAVDRQADLLFVSSPVAPGGETPDSGATALFLFGVAGLGVAGSRRSRGCLSD